MKESIKNRIKAARPATLTVTVISTTFGVLIAYKDGFLFQNGELLWDIWRIFLVTIAGVLLQSAVNMINNFFEEDVDNDVKKQRVLEILGYKRTKEEVLDFKTAIGCALITVGIGFYLTFFSGIQLLWLEIIGMIAAYAYAGKPFNYKEKGLGALMSFIMMGPLLIYASYYVFSKTFSLNLIMQSFSFGLFIPAILIANELRDYGEDKRKSINTLTVRIGFENGKRVYFALIAAAYLVIPIFIFIGVFPTLTMLVFLTLPMTKKPIECLKETNRKKIVPFTAKIHFFYGVGLILILFFTK